MEKDPSVIAKLGLPDLGFPGSSVGKETACKAEDLGSIPDQEAPLEMEKPTHSSTVAWEIPWTEEPGGLQFMRSAMT